MAFDLDKGTELELTSQRAVGLVRIRTAAFFFSVVQYEAGELGMTSLFFFGKGPPRSPHFYHSPVSKQKVSHHTPVREGVGMGG